MVNNNYPIILGHKQKKELMKSSFFIDFLCICDIIYTNI